MSCDTDREGDMSKNARFVNFHEMIPFWTFSQPDTQEFSTLQYERCKINYSPGYTQQCND